MEKAGACVQDVLSEPRKSWPTRWDEYVAAAVWVKRTTLDRALHSAMTPSRLLFGRSPRTAVDILIPLIDDTEATGGLGHFIENRGHN